MDRPRVKSDHAPCRFDDGTVRIGGEIYGLAADVEDPKGWVWAAMELMDGRHGVTEIVRSLCTRFTELSSSDAERLVDKIIFSGYIEDASAEMPAELSASEIERYHRNNAFLQRIDLRPQTRAWDAQVRLKESRVLVIGVGGTGSHAVWSLAAAGVGHIHCVDDDVVEATNLTRQTLYTEEDLGRSKVDVVAERIPKGNSNVTVTVERRTIKSDEDLARILPGYDALALCADEPREEIRSIANRQCYAAQVPWVGGGYDGPLITVGVFGPDGPCHDCVVAGEQARRKPGGEAHIGGSGALAPSAGISGQLVAYEIISFLTGVARRPTGYVRGVNLIAPDQAVYVRHPSREGCDVCHV